MVPKQGNMSIRQSRPFTVEIKGKRRKPLWATADPKIHHIVDGPPPASSRANGEGGSRATVRLATDIISGQPKAAVRATQASSGGIEPFSEPMAEQAEAVVRPRILPDLSPLQDPIEVRLREEAEARAARRHRPRGPRRKIEAEPTQTAAAEHEPTAAQEVTRGAKPLMRSHQKGSVLRAKVPQPVIARQPASMPDPSLSTAQAQNGSDHGSRRAARAALRKARRKGFPIPLRPGERWKRRLPKSAW